MNEEYKTKNREIVREHNWIGDKILNRIPNRDIFRGYNPNLSSGSDRLSSIINDADFRKKNDIFLIDISDNDISRPIKLGAFLLDIRSTYLDNDIGRSTKEFANCGNWTFNPRFQIYNDKSVEVFRGFYQHRRDTFPNKNSKLFYQCDLIVPVGNTTLGTKYISPVKNKELLSEISKIVNITKNIFI